MARGLRGVRDDLSELVRGLLDMFGFQPPLLNPAHTDSPPRTPTGPGARHRRGAAAAGAPSLPPPAPAAVESQQAAASPPSPAAAAAAAADQIAVEVVGAARALAARPDAWIRFDVRALDEDSVISDIQRDHMESIEKLVPDLASLRGRLCPSYMNEDIFWKIYFRLLESNIIEHSSEKLAPDLCNALSLTKQKKQQAAQEGKMKKQSKKGKKVADASSHTLEIPQANLDSENRPHNDDVNIEETNRTWETKEVQRRRTLSSSRTLEEPRHVFDKFSPSEVDDGIKGKEPIAEGSYGSVYQTNIRGTTVAVKILMKQHGSKAKKDFESEIEIFKTIQHENLVTLLGACIEKWALIFEFCPKGTLGDRLSPPTTSSSSSSNSSSNSGNSRRRSSGTLQDWKPLSWEERVRAARGICSGLKFLHTLHIAHCDLKPNNILFDAKDVCKICDFGLVRPLRLTRDTVTPVHYTGRFGTPSYWDPEFIQNRKGKLTRKSDVYALGIILLQLVTGKPAAGLRDWVSNKVREQAGIGDTEKCQQLVDPKILDDLKATSKKEDALKMIDLGLQCSRDTRKERPDVATVCSVIESMLNAG